MQPNTQHNQHSNQLGNSENISSGPQGGPVTVSLVKPAIVPDEFYTIWQKHLADGLNHKRARKAAIAEYTQIRPDFVAAEVPVKIEGVLTIKELAMRLPVDKPVEQALFDMGFDQAEIELLTPVIESRVEYVALPKPEQSETGPDTTIAEKVIDTGLEPEPVSEPEQAEQKEPEKIVEDKPIDKQKLQAEYNRLKKRYFRKDGLMKKNVSNQIKDRIVYLQSLLKHT